MYKLKSVYCATELSRFRTSIDALEGASVIKGSAIKSISLFKLDKRLESKKNKEVPLCPIQVVPKSRQVLIGWRKFSGLGEPHQDVGAVAVDWASGTGRPVGPLLWSSLQIAFSTAVAANGQLGVLHGGSEYGAYVMDLASGQVEPAREHRKPGEHLALGRVQQLPGPVDHGAQRLLARQAGPRAAGQDGETLVETGIQLGHRHDAQAGGGQCVVRDGRVLGLLPLPIAGLMSDQPAAMVIRQQRALLEAARAIGCPHADPFMPLSFLPLPVIPKLKLTDLGLVDVERFAVVPLEVED